ncbi:MAG: TetR/AcrR family transcriptional regulator [Sphingobium sp.]
MKQSNPQESQADNPGTKENLLAAAEQLFSKHGIEAASLRQISKLSGNRNLFAAQYHFGDKDSLIHAILEKHAPKLDALRARMLQDAQPLETMTPTEILTLIIRPLATYRDAKGERRFLRFLKFVMQYDPYSQRWTEHHDAAPNTRAVYVALRRALSRPDEASWHWKLGLVGRMIVEAIVEYDLHGRPAGLSEDDLVREVAVMAAGALSA